MTTTDNKVDRFYALQLTMPVQLCYDQGKRLCCMSEAWDDDAFMMRFAHLLV